MAPVGMLGGFPGSFFLFLLIKTQKNVFVVCVYYIITKQK